MMALGALVVGRFESLDYESCIRVGSSTDTRGLALSWSDLELLGLRVAHEDAICPRILNVWRFCLVRQFEVALIRYLKFRMDPPAVTQSQTSLAVIDAAYSLCIA